MIDKETEQIVIEMATRIMCAQLTAQHDVSTIDEWDTEDVEGFAIAAVCMATAAVNAIKKAQA